MPTVQFKSKVNKVYEMDGTLAYEYLQVPKLTRSHCDMHAFRMHKRFGSYANSDLFQSMLTRAVAQQGVKITIRLDRIPPTVTIDTSGFLAKVSIEVE
jgi:hypothetical protein